MDLKFPFEKKIICVLSSPLNIRILRGWILNLCEQIKLGNLIFTGILTIKPNLPNGRKPVEQNNRCAKVAIIYLLY